MTDRISGAPPVAFSVGVYRLLLHTYPGKFQREYGPHMLQVFRDSCLRETRQGRPGGFARLWAITLLDLLHSLFEQHLHKETDMSKSRLIKWSGWAFILGAFTFIIFLSGSDPLALTSSIICSILLAIGMIGLRARFGEIAGGIGRNILTAGVLGMALLYILLAALAVLYYSGILSRAQVHLSESAWILLYGGPAIGLTALTFFGLATLRRNLMGRLSWLLVLAGIWYPALYFFVFGYLFTRNGVYPDQYQTEFSMLLLAQFLALCPLGATLAADTAQESAAG